MSQATDALSTPVRTVLQGAINEYNSADGEDRSCLDMAGAKCASVMARPARSRSDIVDLTAVEESSLEGHPGKCVLPKVGSLDSTHRNTPTHLRCEACQRR